MKYIYQFIFGGVGYALMEIAYRGYTHSSMFIAGGICFCLLVQLSKTGMPFLMKCLSGGLVICAVEFAAGCIVNLWLNLNVWDYSNYGFDIMGQVCLRYFLIWSALSGAVMLVYPLFVKSRNYNL